MSKAVYISTLEKNSGKSIVSLGLIDLLLRQTQNIGYFRPVIKSRPSQKDFHTDLILNYFNLNQTYEESYLYSSEQINDLIGSGQSELVIDKIIDRYKEFEKKFDFVVVEGTDYVGENIAFEFDVNAQIARNLGCPVLLIGSGKDKSPREAAGSIQLAVSSFMNLDCEVIGTILNRVSADQVADFTKEFNQKLQSYPDLGEVSIVPESKMLSNPSVIEITEQLDAEILFGEELIYTNLVERFSVAGMGLTNYLDFLTENCAVIASSDRGEIIVGSLQAHLSSNYPNLSCIILTGNFEIPGSLYKLLKGLKHNIPIIKVQPNTYQTAIGLSNVKANLRLDNPEKLAVALQSFQQHVDTKRLENKLIQFESKGMTPKMFKYQLKQSARSQRKRIVLPEGGDLRILKATELLQEMDLVDLTLLHTKPEELIELIQEHGINIDLSRTSIVSPITSSKYVEYSEALYEARKHKNVTLEIAKDLMMDESYFGTMMVLKGDADGMVSGAINTTQHTIRPALQFVKTKKGINVVSSVFFMCLADRVLVYGDCAVNPNPTAEQLAEIAISSAETASSFGVTPKIAMLSYSSGSSGKGEEVEKVRTATNMVKERRPELMIEGPIQYDAAVDPVVGKKKMPNSEVAGQATVLIFPDLNTGNNTYKAVQRETGAIAIGPVLQGLNKPVNDLSRGCTVEDIVNTVIITAIQSQNK